MRRRALRPRYSRRRGPPGQRRSLDSILIVCGGTATEPQYFKSLIREKKLSTVEVVALPRDPLSIVNRAIELRDQRRTMVAAHKTLRPEFDDIWCVFDVENPAANPTLFDATALAQSAGIQVGTSMPSFEYWFLLHFLYTDRPFMGANELIQELRRHIPHYHKNCDLFPEIAAGTPTAISRADRILENHVDDAAFPNPSTHVHVLVRKLLSMARW